MTPQTVSPLTPTCIPVELPVALQLQAARLATAINPANIPRPVYPLTPVGLAAITSKLWKTGPLTLTVQFLDNPTQACRNLILRHANAWNEKGASVKFVETAGQGQIRVARSAPGYWCYIGTDALSIPADQATMNLEAWTENMADYLCRHVIRHEFGHALGFPHEHLRKEIVTLLDRNKTIMYFQNTYGWDADKTIFNVLTPLEDVTLTPGPVDQTSIMTYQIPGYCTISGNPIVGGTDIDALDYDFVRQVYPGRTSNVFSFELHGEAAGYVTDVPTGWGVSAWSHVGIAFNQDYMLIPGPKLLCVPENYLRIIGPADKITIDIVNKHAITPDDWVMRVGVGQYLPGLANNEKNVIILAVQRKMALLPSGFGWQALTA